MLSHQFPQYAIDLAYRYTLTAQNDCTMVTEINKWFQEAKRRPGMDFYNTFPYRCASTTDEYFVMEHHLDFDNQQRFPDLCRRVLWHHYAPEYGFSINLPSTRIEAVETEFTRSSRKPEPQENDMQVLNTYKSQAEATVKLIHGRPVEDYSEEELIDLVRFAEHKRAEIKDVAKHSKRMAEKRKQYKADIAVYVAALDAIED